MTSCNADICMFCNVFTFTSSVEVLRLLDGKLARTDTVDYASIAFVLSCVR